MQVSRELVFFYVNARSASDKAGAGCGCALSFVSWIPRCGVRELKDNHWIFVVQERWLVVAADDDDESCWWSVQQNLPYYSTWMYVSYRHTVFPWLGMARFHRSQRKMQHQSQRMARWNVARGNWFHHLTRLDGWKPGGILLFTLPSPKRLGGEFEPKISGGS